MKPVRLEEKAESLFAGDLEDNANMTNYSSRHRTPRDREREGDDNRSHSVRSHNAQLQNSARSKTIII